MLQQFLTSVQALVRQPLHLLQQVTPLFVQLVALLLARAAVAMIGLHQVMRPWAAEEFILSHLNGLEIKNKWYRFTEEF